MAGDLGMRLGLHLKEDLCDPLEMGGKGQLQHAICCRAKDETGGWNLEE